MELTGKTVKTKQIKLPDKRTINLAGNLEKQASMIWAVPGTIVIVMLAALFGKVAVADRLSNLNAANSRVDELQTEVDQLYDIYDDMGDVKGEYAHVTYSGLTEAEMQYFNRLDVIDLIEKKVMNRAEVDNWQVKENELIVPLRASSLEVVKQIVSDLESDDLVNYCVMNNANTTEATEDSAEYVTAQLTVYLNSGIEDESTEDGGEE